MTEIIPAILPKDYEELKNKIALVRGYVPVVQVDICDGAFVKSITWPFDSGSLAGISLDPHFNGIINENEGMPFWEDIDFELDLMVSDSIENFDIYAKLGARRIVFHLEAVGELEDFRDFIEGMDVSLRDTIEIGIAFNPDFDLVKIKKFINIVDFVQFMGISRIGFQGEKFNDKVLDNIKKLRKDFPDLPISVDGGVNIENGKQIIEAGASRLVVGSAIFSKDDIIETIEEFKSL